MNHSWLDLLLLIWNAVELKYYSLTISLKNILEVVMSHFQKYVFQKKQKT